MKNCLALFVATFCLCAGAQAQDTPNVVVFMADDMGWNDWSAEDSFYLTPNLDRLSSEGVTFDRAYAAASVCSPTRAAFMTGKTPAQLHMTSWIPGNNQNGRPLQPPNWTKDLPFAEVTIAEVLSSAGYATGHFGKWHLGDNATPLNHGYDLNIGGGSAGNPGSGYFADADGDHHLPNLRDGSAPPGTYLAQTLGQYAVDFVQDAVQQETPFLASMQFYSPHAPIQAPADTITMFQQREDTGQFGNRSNVEVTYAAMVFQMDMAIGRMLDELDAQGVADNTLIIFASDNGGEDVHGQGGNGILRGAKNDPYEGGIRVPTIISWAGGGVRAGVNNDTHISTIDFYSTILAATGIAGDASHNQNVEGLNLLEVLRDGDAELDRNALTWHTPQWVGDQDPNSSILYGDWKLIYRYIDQSWELYDLVNDIGEQTNLADDNPGLVSTIAQELFDWLVEVDAQTPVDPTDGLPVALPQVSGEGLGDIDGDGFVGAADLDILLANWGNQTRLLDWSAGELSGDGIVGLADLNIVLDNWPNGEAPDVNVPEPTSALGFGALMFAIMRRP